MMLFSARQGTSTNEFIWALLNSPGIRRQVRLLTAGAAAPRINIADIRKFSVFLPPYDRQVSFSRFVECVRKEEDLFANSLRCLEELFDSLRQRAFCGEL
jgi:hypothetical protein